MSTYVSSISIAGTTHYLPYEDDHKWTLQGGYEPVIESWTVPADIGEVIATAVSGQSGTGRECTLELGSPSSPTTVDRVVILKVAPHEDPLRRRVVMADVRVYLQYAWFAMDVNVRTRIGDRRVIGAALENVELGTVADAIAYAPSSIRNGTTAYTWSTLRDDVMAYMLQEKHGRPEIDWTVDVMSVSIGDKVVEQATTDSVGTTGLARAIETTPGAGIYVDLAGAIHVYDRTLGAEAAVIEGLPEPLRGHGSVVWVDNSGLRPASWRVYFDYELEIRWEYRSPAAQARKGQATNPLDSALLFTQLENVLQVTDPRLTIPADPRWGSARTVGEGTWITFNEAYKAWGRMTVGPFTLPELTDSIVASNWFNGGLESWTLGGASTPTDPVWAARIDQVRRCYRTVFRALPATWHHVRHAWNARAAVWDKATATRAPSPVYCNYHRQPVDRFVASPEMFFGVNVSDSYPSNGLLASGRPSGFLIDVIDQELGIIEIERDPSRHPGAARIAVSDVEARASLTAANDIIDPSLQALKSDWSMATVLSCAPSTPNDLRRFYSVPITAAQAAVAAGLTFQPVCGGPQREDRCQLGEARVAWTESDNTPLNVVFTLMGAAAEDDEQSALRPVNLENELQPLAKAVAASDLMRLLDHYEGSLAVPLDRDLVPLGSISRVVHRVLENRAVTVVQCEGPAPVYRYEDFLTGSARSYLLKEIATRR